MRASRLAIVATVIAAAAPARAASPPSIDVPAGPLTAALMALGRQSNINVLFSEALLGNRQTAGVRGSIEPGEALARLLAGTGLSYYRTTGGVYVIGPATAAPEPLLPAETIPEILVIGRRTQNSDIRRSENDIQPYQVYGRRGVERAQSNTIDEFTRTRLPSNAQIAAPAQLGSDTRSEINLRGLGANQTLVLVDGRRLPRPPSGTFSFNQPDLNALPIEMIDRIEVLPATAGGVYGTGAIAGTVNVILRRDYRDAEVSATSGITSRGDAFTYRLFGHLGFSPDRGRTNIMVAIGRSQEATLEVEDRDYLTRAIKRRYANARQAVLASAPVGNGINIVGTQPLVFDAALGGAALGSTFTTLPLNLGTDSARTNALLANAGTLNLDQASTSDKISVVTPPITRSILVNMRHDFGGGIEADLDLIDTRNSGLQRPRGSPSIGYILAGDRPTNPFQQAITISFPEPYSNSTVSRTVNQMLRVTAGLIVPLPGSWRAYAEWGEGHAKASRDTTQTALSSDFYNGLYNGRVFPGKPALDPLGDWLQFQSALASYTAPSTTAVRQTNHFQAYSLRAAGPLATLAGGRATLTLLAQQRQERNAATTFSLSTGDQSLSLNLPRIAQQVRSLYGEARLPLTADRGLLSNLEAQLSLRQDWTRSTLPGAATFLQDDPPPFAKVHSTTLYTVGGRFEPLPGLTLRASTAIGALPPTTSQIGTQLLVSQGGAQDPKRNGRLIGTETTMTLMTGGRADLRPERARSLSIGAIVMPAGSSGPRVSVDFTRILKHSEIVPLPFGTTQLLLANESRYPNRVTRAPLTAADQALGFTGGPITNIDLTSINLGKTKLDSIDLAANQSIRIAGAGEFDAYVRATWEPTFRQRANEAAGWIERVGFRDGPLEWRGNAGVNWTYGRLTLGVNAQFYSRYRVAHSNQLTSLAVQQASEQGSRHIPAQAYFDLAGIYRFGPARPRDVPGPELRWGVLNILDRRPPTVVDPLGPGYSYYGDPRRRRLQLTLNIPLGQ